MAALVDRGRYGISLGLGRIAALLAGLDHPERALRGALVAGTNGKGSVVALVEAVLRAAGHRTGTMPKPHLVAYRERICVDGEAVSADRFAAAVARVLPVVDDLPAELGPPTEFELLTAAAVDELARSRVEVAVVEVGLGGRLDATNALDLGVAAITNVALDHQRQLGHSLAAIGAEKAAIVKRGNVAVTGATGRGLAPIVERCRALGVSLRRAAAGGPYAATLRASGWDGLLVDLRRPDGELRGVRIGLLGGHQAQNAAVALALLDALAADAARRGAGLRFEEATIRQGFAAARWPGRLELLPGARVGVGRVLLDGAHNPAGARALAAALAELGLRRPAIVLGAMRDKPIATMLRALAGLDPRPVFTRAPGTRAADPRRLLRTWQRIAGPTADGGMVADDGADALRRAADLAPADQPVVVAGSLYLVGAVRGLLTGEGGP